MITLQHLFYGSLAPWTDVFKPEYRPLTIIRQLPSDFSLTGEIFFHDLPRGMAALSIPAVPKLLAEWHAFSLAPPSKKVSGKLRDLILCCAPKKESERLPFLIMGFTIERMMAHLESARKDIYLGELYLLYTHRLTRRLIQYHHDLVHIAIQHHEYLTTLTYFDMFVTFALLLISLSLPKEQKSTEMKDAADEALKRLYMPDYWPAGVENTREALAGLLTLVTAAESRSREKNKICSTEDFLTIANEVKLDLARLKDGIIELGRSSNSTETTTQYLRPGEILKRYGIARTTLTYWRTSGLLVKCRQTGRRFEYNKEEVIEVINRFKKPEN